MNIWFRPLRFNRAAEKAFSAVAAWDSRMSVIVFQRSLPTRRLAVSAAGVVGLALLAASPAALAARSPCGTAGNYHDGAWALNTTQYGASAYIQAYDPAICNSASSGTAWTLETGSGTTDGWAQAGYGNVQGAYVVFSQWTKTDSGPFNTKYFAAPSGTAQYVVDYNFNNGIMYMDKGATTLDQTNFDPAVSWTAPWIPEFMGETLHCESDVPGTAPNRVGYTSVNKKARDSTWGSISSLSLPTPDCGGTTRYHRNWSTQPTSFQIYTDPL